jgi:hypothetical protein
MKEGCVVSRVFESDNDTANHQEYPAKPQRRARRSRERAILRCLDIVAKTLGLKESEEVFKIGLPRRQI